MGEITKVNRKAEAKGGKTFAKIQKDWLVNREAILEAIRSTGKLETETENNLKNALNELLAKFA